MYIKSAENTPSMLFVMDTKHKIIKIFFNRENAKEYIKNHNRKINEILQ